MATIGSVTKRDDGRYEGQLRALSVRADIGTRPDRGHSGPIRGPQPAAAVDVPSFEPDAGTTWKDFATASNASAVAGSRDGKMPPCSRRTSAYASHAAPRAIAATRAPIAGDAARGEGGP